MYYQIEDGEQKEKIEKYLKRLGVNYTTAKTLEQLYILETINLVQEIFDNMPVNFLNHKLTAGITSYGEQVSVISEVLDRLRANPHEMTLKTPLYEELRDSIVKKCEEAIHEASLSRTRKVAV